MIPCWVAILALFVGSTVGCIIMAIFAARRDDCDGCLLIEKLIDEEDKK
ncbi:hypothetical protein Ga0466249_005280 [Sporomusaceae bacterium BoRhaA]|nr:hypothetical protein [Pelorhabdus rhamnosifermentans]